MLPLIDPMTLSAVLTSTILQTADHGSGERYSVACSDIPDILMGLTFISQAVASSRYEAALDAGDLDRVRRMIQTDRDIATQWATRLNELITKRSV